MKRFIKKGFIFLIFFIPVLILKKEVTPYYLGNGPFHAKLTHFYDNVEAHAYNTVFFGSSRIYRHVNGPVIDSILTDFNIKSFNFATAGTFNPEAYYIYTNFINDLETNDIKYAFMELQTLNRISDSNLLTTKASYWNSLHYLNYSINYVQHSDYEKAEKRAYYSRYIQSFIYSFLDFKILPKSITSNTFHVDPHGYSPLDIELFDADGDNEFKSRWLAFHSDSTNLASRIEMAKKIKELASDDPVNQYHLNYLHFLIQQSKEKGIHLIFVLPPRLSNESYFELVPLARSLPTQNVIKLNDPETYYELYLTEYSFDAGHLNSKGADIFSSYLAENFKHILTELENSISETQH